MDLTSNSTPSRGAVQSPPCVPKSGDPSLSGTSLGAETAEGKRGKMRRDESRRGRQECLRHVNGADFQVLGGRFLASVEAANTSIWATSLGADAGDGDVSA